VIAKSISNHSTMSMSRAIWALGSFILASGIFIIGRRDIRLIFTSNDAECGFYRLQRLQLVESCLIYSDSAIRLKLISLRCLKSLWFAKKTSVRHKFSLKFVLLRGLKMAANYQRNHQTFINRLLVRPFTLRSHFAKALIERPPSAIAAFQ
jgi:hypothetical protein